MSDIQMMNSQMLEIIKNYLEIYSFFNEKLEEIKADAILNINLELLKASIMDLNINISNFKSNLQSNQLNQFHTASINFTELDNKNFLALFFLYLMQIDKDSILNKSDSTSTSNNLLNITNSQENSESNNINTYNSNKKINDYLNLD